MSKATRFSGTLSMAWLILHIWLLFRHQSHMIGKTTNTKCSNFFFLTIPISTEKYPLLFFSQNNQFTRITWTHSVHRPGGRGVVKMVISQILHVSASVWQGTASWFQLLRKRKLPIRGWSKHQKNETRYDNAPHCSYRNPINVHTGNYEIHQ